MSTITIDGFISLGVVLSLLLIYVMSKPSGNNKAVEHLMRFNELAHRNKLSITDKEILGDILIGIDSLQKKLFILQHINDQYETEIINLHKLIRCSKKEIYKHVAVEVSALPSQRSLLIDKVVLDCIVTGNGKPIQIPFYISGKNQSTELPEMLRKIKKWELCLTGIVAMQQQHPVPTGPCYP